jgi:glycosyltransferase involved in cell wall biosynthesis
MHVLHICPTHFSKTSVVAGAERYSFELAKAMARRTPTTLLTFGDEAFETTEGPLRIRCHRAWTYVQGNRMNPLTPAFLRDVLSADVVHCHQYATLASDLAIIYGALGRKRIFVTDLAGSTAISLWYKLRLWNRVHKFLLISHYNQSLLDRFDRPKEVIYGGVDAERFRIDSTQKRESVLFVGRLMEHKGVEVLLEAVGPSVKTLIMGRPSRDEYGATLRKLAAGKTVEFRQDAPDEDLLKEYARTFAVAIPALVDSGYTTALEAMACGVPVVGTSVGSLPELVADGETGFIVPPRDPAALREKLDLLANNPGLVARMGAAGRQRIEKMFTWDHVVERCLQHYRS